jgi:hypothetical protein
MRRRIRKEKLKLLYIFDCPDSDEKREKQKRSERSQPEARESVIVENPLCWDVELKIGQPGTFGATWIGLLLENPTQSIELNKGMSA